MKAPVDTALGDRAEVDQDPEHRINGRPRISVIDVVLLEMPTSDISRLSGVHFLRPALFHAIQTEGLSGLEQRGFTMSFDRQQRELGGLSGSQVPELFCVEVHGRVEADDFAHVEGESGLIVSHAALAVLRRFDLTGVRVESF
ncbi:hypothetical protein ACIQTT_08710 [Microbacterium sp. NPDC090225]|uniref:hypothetical protein n=1 Tax=Microbacterium sp. NPDC090225 TaxID=3364207 RepID=UPI00382C0F5C